MNEENEFKGVIELFELERYFEIEDYDEDLELDGEKLIKTHYKYPKNRKDFDLICEKHFIEYKQRFPVCEFDEFVEYTVNKLQNLALIIENVLPVHTYLENDIYNTYKAYVRYLRQDTTLGSEKDFNLQIEGSFEDFEKDLIKLFTTIKNGKVRLHEIDIKHFVNQNFANGNQAFEIKTFSPNANKSEINQIIVELFSKYGRHGEKAQWLNMFNKNFSNYNEKYINNIKDAGVRSLKL